MDGVGGGVPGPKDGESAPASYPRFIHGGDLVKFKSTCAHGDRRGVAMVTQDGSEPLVRVQFGDGTVATPDDPHDLTIVDRGCSMYRGLHVTPAPDRGGRRVGVVTGVAMELDLIRLNGGGEEEGEESAADEAGTPVVVARGVSPRELRRVMELCPGDWVVSGPWLGRVVKAHLDVDVRFDDGAVCRVARADDGHKLRFKDKEWGRHGVSSPYYPGQRVFPPWRRPVGRLQE